MRGRAFAVLMSSNVAMLTIGMIVAGHVTDLYGPRWVWGVAAATAALAAVIGFVLARGAAATDRVRSDGLAVAAHSGEAAEQSSL
jgi:MFS family permease